MSSKTAFTGLTMPVFTAFGWAGEETAINFALDQLEQFVHLLHNNLSRQAKGDLPFAGLSRTNQSVYISASESPEEDLHLVFFARPLSLEMQVAMTDTKALAKALKNAEAQPVMAHRLITELGADWSLRLQQVQVDDESGEQAHYQDLFKDSITALLPEVSAEAMSKAAYLNSEDKWVTPFYLSRRYPAEQAAAMGLKISSVLSEQIDALLPLIHFLTGRRASSKRKSKPKARTVKPMMGGKSEDDASSSLATIMKPEDGFTHVALVKPLHLRRGFINLTSAHWPFFAINSRTETRPVTIYYDGVYDKESAVWRMLPNDLARIVLSPSVHHWYEDNFSQGDEIHVTVTRLDKDEIQISLRVPN
ncbi:hypothetical protein [Candidatus Leptofilum sp.]|uniref:hypothetical protein n=1 Tax=Candidatus Leptofilum sp. TaxID=3241576 RepID=UPI003B5C7409